MRYNRTGIKRIKIHDKEKMMSRYKKLKRNKMTATAMAIVALLIGMNLGRMGQDTTDQKLPNGITNRSRCGRTKWTYRDYSGAPYVVLGDNVPDFYRGGKEDH